LEKSLSRSSSDTSTEIKRNDVVERPQIRNDEHEEVIPSNVKGGAPHPPRGHEEHDGHTAHEDQENPKVTEESVNFDKCAAVQTRAMKQSGFGVFNSLCFIALVCTAAHLSKLTDSSVTLGFS